MKHSPIFAALLLGAVAGCAPAAAQTETSERRQRGEAVMNALNLGQPQPALEALRRDFPFLADAITDYALGEVWARPGLDHRTRQLVTVAAFAALGNRAQMKIHAAYALNHGVSREELKEVVYLTTVLAGFPRAIDAAMTLTELFNERPAQEAAMQNVDAKNADVVGMWVSEDGNIRLEMLPNGRYDEARGSRKSAYTGRYRVQGNQIEYFDDSGFTAKGTLTNGVLTAGPDRFRRQQ